MFFEKNDEFQKNSLKKLIKINSFINNFLMSKK